MEEKEANELVKRFLAELDGCKSEQERINKIWELIHGIIRSARKDVLRGFES